MYQRYNSRAPNSFRPTVVKQLLMLNIGVFIISIFLPVQIISLSPGYAIQVNMLDSWFALWPISLPEGFSRFLGNGELPFFQIWQIVTYSFLHGGDAHLFFNMVALLMFGVQIEQLWGAKRFAVYYFTCVIGAALVQLIAVGIPDSIGGYVPTVGASGGVFGVLLAFGMMFPNQRLFLLFTPIFVKAKWVVIGYGLLELTLGVTNTQSMVAHFAHLGGMLFGFLLIQYWRGRFPFR